MEHEVQCSLPLRAALSIGDGLRAGNRLRSAVRAHDDLGDMTALGGVLLPVVGREAFIGLAEAEDERADQQKTLGTGDAREEDGERALVLVDGVELLLSEVVRELLVDIGASSAVVTDARSGGIVDDLEQDECTPDRHGEAGKGAKLEDEQGEPPAGLACAVLPDDAEEEDGSTEDHVNVDTQTPVVDALHRVPLSAVKAHVETGSEDSKSQEHEDGREQVHEELGRGCEETHDVGWLLQIVK